jgi:hypothetical protein
VTHRKGRHVTLRCEITAHGSLKKGGYQLLDEVILALYIMQYVNWREEKLIKSVIL